MSAPTQPTESHKTQASMWLSAFRHRFHPGQTVALAQLLADSEARAVQSAMRDMERALTAEREKVRVLETALRSIAVYGEEHDGCCPYGCDTPTIAHDALAATEEGA